MRIRHARTAGGSGNVVLERTLAIGPLVSLSEPPIDFSEQLREFLRIAFRNRLLQEFVHYLLG